MQIIHEVGRDGKLEDAIVRIWNSAQEIDWARTLGADASIQEEINEIVLKALYEILQSAILKEKSNGKKS